MRNETSIKNFIMIMIVWVIFISNCNKKNEFYFVVRLKPLVPFKLKYID